MAIQPGRPIDSVGLSSNYVWLLAQTHVDILPFARHMSGGNFDLQGSGVGQFSPFGPNGVIVSFNGSGEVSLLREQTALYKVTTAATEGISCLTSVQDNLLYCARNSCVVRCTSLDGREISCFAGHHLPITGIQDVGPNCFVTRAWDNSVRLWDLRSAQAQIVIPTPCPVSSLTGNQGLLTLALQNNKVCVVDLTAVPAKHKYGIELDYYPVAVKHCEANSSLFVFGVAQHGGGQQGFFLREYRNVYDAAPVYDPNAGAAPPPTYGDFPF
jgi:WD40 repeat protein